MTSEQFPKGPNMSPVPESLTKSIENLKATRAKVAEQRQEFNESIRNDLPPEDTEAEKLARKEAEDAKLKNVYGEKGPYWKDL